MLPLEKLTITDIWHGLWKLLRPLLYSIVVLNCNWGNQGWLNQPLCTCSACSGPKLRVQGMDVKTTVPHSKSSCIQWKYNSLSPHVHNPALYLWWRILWLLDYRRWLRLCMASGFCAWCSDSPSPILKHNFDHEWAFQQQQLALQLVICWYSNAYFSRTSAFLYSKFVHSCHTDR